MPRQQIFAARLFSSRRSAEEFEGSTRCLDSSQLFRYWTPNGCSVSLLPGALRGHGMGINPLTFDKAGRIGKTSA